MWPWRFIPRHFCHHVAMGSRYFAGLVSASNSGADPSDPDAPVFLTKIEIVT